MEPVPTTFIPKKPLITKPPERKPIGIVLAISVIAFVLSLLGLLGAYGYSSILKNQVGELTKDLKKTENAFNPRTLRELERADNRITTTEKLLANHITVLPLFDFFSENTLRTVRFKNFSYTYSPDTKKVELRMSGEARDYESIALQSDVFSASGKLIEFFFSDLNLDGAGRVIFTFTATVDPLLVSYAESIKQQSQ